MTVYRHVPNLLSLTRLLASPVLYAACARRQRRATELLLAFAAASDLLDGQISRRFGWVSAIGSSLDPIADRCTILAATIGYWRSGDVPAAVPASAVCRDLLNALLVSAVRVQTRQALPVRRMGKVATATLYVSFMWLALASRPSPAADRTRTPRAVLTLGLALYVAVLPLYVLDGSKLIAQAVDRRPVLRRF